MRALKPSDLPSHPDLAPQQTSGSPPELQSFVTEALLESEGFMTTYLPRQFKVKSSSKQSPPATAPVELLTREISATDLPREVRNLGASSETWFARTSVHENAAKSGTATWQEFDQGLRANHSQHEMEYTPDVHDAHQVLSWDSELEGMGRQAAGWEDVSMYLVEMRHHIPPPLNNRVFSVLVITAKKTDRFIVVQIPVDLAKVPGAKYDRDSKVTAGMYCSIEYGQLIDDGSKVKWQMATASDAKGVLPMWAQKLGVPGAVVKDVGLFIDWTQKRRSR